MSNFRRIIVTGSLDLALPMIEADAWCHAECYRRWAGLSRTSQGVIGGHIHWDEESRSWTVPFKVPLRIVGRA